TERIDVKKKIFSCVDAIASAETVIATNSSSLDVNVLARSTKRTDRVVWMHYFYLPHKNRAAEYAGSESASPRSIETARKYLKLGGKLGTFVRGSRKGGVADILFVALLHEATRMVEEGFGARAIEAAARQAYGLPMGFLKLMDATGLPIGLASMKSFSDPSDPNDSLYRVYGNFFEPRPPYVALVEKLERGAKPSDVVWIPDNLRLDGEENRGVVDELAGRFLAVGFVTAAETVAAGLITVGDLELLTQNAFLWKRGPFEIMNDIGKRKVREVVEKRAELAKSFKQDFPVTPLLRKEMGTAAPWPFHIRFVTTEAAKGEPVRRIILSNPRAANAMNNAIFSELGEEFRKADDDPSCAVIIFDTAPIKSFIAGADVRAFFDKMTAGKFDAIRKETAEWQRILFKVMTGTAKPKVAIVDGNAFGGGVEIACAFAHDPQTVVIITNRTTFALPETRLGIYPGLRGTLTLPQLIHRATGDPERALALARYYILAGGTATSSPRVIHHLGCADVIVPQQTRDSAADAIARAIIGNGGRMLSIEQLDALPIERLGTAPGDAERVELQIASEMFSQADLVPSIMSQARGHQPVFYTGEMKGIAERMARRVAANSPNAVRAADFLLARGFEGYLQGRDMDSLAAFELEHELVPVFEHPDARIGIGALLDGKFPEFKRRYPFQ
ncbi:MAG TPA: enoyl-CoA hydratase/isomerase family protein, partial [Bacteroidota bacterium]|nr:enoyl-CoA hydratase/isomerase family protein [Bacteroidota bacterium]